MNRFLRIFSTFSALFLLTLSGLGQTGLVISQVYGGGGNSGATYRYDYVELYNTGASPVDLSTYSIQYASSTGSSWNVTPLSGTVQPGHYFLIRGCTSSASTNSTPGSNAPELPVTADFSYTNYDELNGNSCSGNTSATSGKIALVSNQTAMTGVAATPVVSLAGTSCPAANAAAIVDLVGYGAATCYEGVSAAPLMSATTADSRTAPPTSAVDDSIFGAGTPNPHNSSSGSAPAALAATGIANPASVVVGQTTSLTVTVSSPSAPANANVTVTGDLRQIGGVQTQAFVNNGDSTFSYNNTTVTSTASGSVTLPVTVSDGMGNTVSANILLAVTQPAPMLAIHDIQGPRSTTTEIVSPYVGKPVQTTGVVTAITSAGFFIQTPDAATDGNPMTPEGIYVYTGSGKVPVSVAIGNLMQVTGTPATFPALNTTSHTPSTELEAPLTIAMISAGNALPAPIALSATNLSPTGGIYQLTPYEGMRVSFASLTSVSGTDGSLSEAAETTTSNGEFYAVITGTARPFREPGIDLRDPVVNPVIQAAVFDDNPERIFVDSGFLKGATPIDVSSGAVLPNVTGVLDFSDAYDDNYVPARLLIDPAYSVASITPGMTVQPVPKPAATEFTVASFNIERFYNTSASDDLYYVPAGVTGYNGSSNTGTISMGQTFTSEAVDVTQAAYTRRLQKVSLAIRTVLNTPDIVTLEEVENQSVANDIANQINSDAGVSNLYTAYSTDNSTFYTQDGTGISVGFLVKNTVDELGFTQFGAPDTFTPTNTMNVTLPAITLNDRPWLVLSAGIKRGTGAKDYPVTVIVNHMKALTGVNDPATNSTRQKKELQAEDIARYIQTLQASGAHVISGGDFNAFEFSDGYTDTLATYTNTNVLPSNQVVEAGVAGLVTPGLTDLALLLPANQRWSYSEYGSAQILDHMVVTQDLASAGAHLAYAHLDADFPLAAYNDATTAARTSDHDAAVGYFTLPAPAVSATLTPASGSFASTVVGGSSSGQVFVLTNTGETVLSITSVATTGPFTQSNTCGTSVAIGGTCAINVVFAPTAAGAQTGSLNVLTNASGTAYTASLAGTGAPAPDFTVTDSAGKSTTSVTVAAGSSVTSTLTFTPNTSFTGTIALSCAIASGTAPTGVTCNVPANFMVGASAVMQSVSFTTTSRTTTSGFGSLWGMTGLFGLAGLVMLSVARVGRLGRGMLQVGGMLALMVAICMTAAGCGGKGSSSGSGSSGGGTPAGAYTYTVTATSGTITHTEAVTLNVQ